MTTSAIITQSSGKAVEFRESAGIFKCLLEHEVSKTKASFEWTGPKINPQAWAEMLAFFKWTQVTEKSEAQVRLFVHPEEGWKIWAFPQKGGTGMTTKEEDNEEAKRQRALIGEGYVPFGTVHHHCNCTAFQSGTDAADEVSVDGLHITIGKMEDPQHDIHCRLYFKGHKFEPNMSAFWDIGPAAMEIIQTLVGLGFKAEEVADRMARKQMCVPAAADLPFNDQWKTNYILPPKMVQTTWCYHCQTHADHVPDACPKKGVERNGHQLHVQRKEKWQTKYLVSAEKLYDELEVSAAVMGYDATAFAEEVKWLGGNRDSELYQLIMDDCAENLVKLSELAAIAAKGEAPPADETSAEKEDRENKESLMEYYGGAYQQ